MRLFRFVLPIALVSSCGGAARPPVAASEAVPGPETVTVRSGALELRALLWRPSGKGPFPAVLFNHGRGATPQTGGRVEDITSLGRRFAARGYVFLAVFRRGEGLSAGRGTFIGDLLARERAAKGDAAAKRLQVRLLETEQLDDALAGLAFLRALPEVDPSRVAVAGHSFGGSLALLVAERDETVRAVVNFGGAAGSWDSSPALRERLVAAVGRIAAPVIFVYAANEFSTAPARVLDAEMTRRSRPHRLLLVPAFGRTSSEGHNVVYLAPSQWEAEVFAFLDRSVSLARSGVDAEARRRDAAMRASRRLGAPASLR